MRRRMVEAVCAVALLGYIASTALALLWIGTKP